MFMNPNNYDKTTTSNESATQNQHNIIPNESVIK